MSTIFIPYVYLLGWKSLDKWYYGVEYGSKTKTANPSNLLSTYFTSSKNVKNFIKRFGAPDVVQIRKTFISKEKAIDWEHKVLRRLKCRSSLKWLNRTDSKVPIFDRKGVIFTPEHCSNISKSKKGKPIKISPEGKIKRLEVSHTPEANQKRKKSMTAKIWVNNNTISKRVIADDPNFKDWNKGRIKTEKTTKRINSLKNTGTIMGKLNKGMVTAFDTKTKEFVRIPKDIFTEEFPRYVGTTSKFIL